MYEFWNLSCCILLLPLFPIYQKLQYSSYRQIRLAEILLIYHYLLIKNINNTCTKINMFISTFYYDQRSISSGSHDHPLPIFYQTLFSSMWKSGHLKRLTPENFTRTLVYQNAMLILHPLIVYHNSLILMKQFYQTQLKILKLLTHNVKIFQWW